MDHINGKRGFDERIVVWIVFSRHQSHERNSQHASFRRSICRYNLEEFSAEINHVLLGREPLLDIRAYAAAS